jgi:hypothetical protein
MAHNDSFAMFAFVECANAKMGGGASGDFPDPSAVDTLKECATQLKYDWAKLSKCTKTDAPVLQNAVALAGSQRGVAFAPTVYVDGKEISTMQGVDINKMLAAICAAYKGEKPAGCKSASLDNSSAIKQQTEQQACAV